MTINYEGIAKRIRRIRKEKKLTQMKLADRTGYSYAYISHLETGRKKVSLKSIFQIANALEVTVDYLLTGNQKKDLQEYSKEFHDLLEDCSDYERAVIYADATAKKQILRAHKDLFLQDEDGE